MSYNEVDQQESLSSTSIIIFPQTSTRRKGLYSFENLPDEIMLIIFSFLNQKDIPSMVRINRKWERLMNNNELWKGFAQRAFMIMKGDFSQEERDYKSLIKENCISSFTDLGTFYGGKESHALSINFDGTVIVGNASIGTESKAFRWTKEKGMESVGTLNGGTGSIARDISFDGTVIVGEVNDGMDQQQLKAFRWTAESGMESLGTLKEGKWSSAWGTNFDGSVIVGYSLNRIHYQQEAFRWTREGGMESIGSLNGGINSSARGISSDGTVIFGSANDENHQIKAFRWTSERGMESLGTLNGGTESTARDISFDGSVIVGEAVDRDANNVWRAIRWTPERGMEPIFSLNGYSISSNARGVNFDGSVIVGFTSQGSFPMDKLDAFRWTPERGVESINKLLRDKGLLSSDWTLTHANAITPNGAVIIGEGRYIVKSKFGGYESLIRGWRAVIPRANLF